MFLCLLAQATQTTVQDVNKGYGSLIFTACFFLALFLLAIWWLKRQA
jgi:hypothetical protein